jgi:4-hydroxy-tetrahydrodipicolinate synthase
MKFKPEGVIPACLLPFDEELRIDAPQFKRHIVSVAAVEGISAITLNAHSTEVPSCTREEQQQVLELALDEVGGKLPVVNGVYADGSQEAARIARAAERGGASALLVFPSNTLSMGGVLRPEMAETHLARIAEASGLPIILFQYPQSSNLNYPLDTLVRLCERIPSIVAIKDWCHEPVLHDRQIRALHGLTRRVNVLSTHSSWLMPSLVLGCDGLLSGMGSVVADLQVALFRAVGSGDLRTAQRLHDQLQPLAQAFYAPPFLDMHNRMKEALVLLGRIKCAAVRPPLCKLGDVEIAGIAAALKASDIHPDGARISAK